MRIADRIARLEANRTASAVQCVSDVSWAEVVARLPLHRMYPSTVRQEAANGTAD